MRGKVVSPRATREGDYGRSGVQGLQGCGPHVHSCSLTHIRPRTCVQSALHRLAVHATTHRTPHNTPSPLLSPSPHPVLPTKERESQRESTLPASLPSVHLHPSHVHFAHRPHDLIPTQLGIPTANLPVDATVTPWISDAKSGVYFGWAALELGKDHPNYKPSSSSTSPAVKGESGENKGGFCIFPMVMSIGYNPFYNNTVRSAEVHVLDKFAADFYGVNMRLLIVGYIRDEKNYDGLDALIEDINTDCEVARRSLERDAWKPAGQQGGTLDASWLTR